MMILNLGGTGKRDISLILSVHPVEKKWKSTVKSFFLYSGHTKRRKRMAKKTIKVCMLCGREDCDGKGYKVVSTFGKIISEYKLVCKNDDRVYWDEWEKHLMFRETIGHGHYNDFHLFPDEYSDEKVKREAVKLRRKKAEAEKREKEKWAKIHKEQRRKTYEELKKEFGENK